MADAHESSVQAYGSAARQWEGPHDMSAIGRRLLVKF